MSDDPREQRYAGDYYSNYMLFRAEADVRARPIEAVPPALVKHSQGLQQVRRPEAPSPQLATEVATQRTVIRQRIRRRGRRDLLLLHRTDLERDTR